jgi:hypothetical protein
MDNLDRTNVVQSLFARRSLLMQLNKNTLLESDKVLDTPFKKFEEVYKRIWINNADQMSMMYAGTGALKVDFTRTGKRTYVGMYNDGVNSCTRYYLNNFMDGKKQDGIDLMLGNYKPYLQNSSPFLDRAKDESIESHFLRSFVLLVSMFSLFAFTSPFSDALLFSRSSENDGLLQLSMIDRLSRYFLVAFILSSAVSAFMVYTICKKGSKIGESMVGRPCLCPELPVV